MSSNCEQTKTIPLSKLKKLGEIIEIGDISPKLLKVSKTNNRTVQINEFEKQEMITSVKESGIIIPLIINLDNEIVSGQLRWHAAIANSLETVPFIRMQFKDAFSERICSMIQDEFHHRLDALDKHLFIKNCIEVDKKTIYEISEALGKHIETVRAWARFQNIPDNIAKDEKAKSKFLNMPAKKRTQLRSILDKPAYKNDTIKSIELVEFASHAPTRELKQIKKDVNSGSPIDTEIRKQRLNERTTLLEVKIPKYLDRSFRDKLKQTNSDYVKVIEKLISGYVRNMFIIEDVE